MLNLLDSENLVELKTRLPFLWKKFLEKNYGSYFFKMHGETKGGRTKAKGNSGCASSRQNAPLPRAVCSKNHIQFGISFFNNFTQKDYFFSENNSFF